MPNELFENVSYSQINQDINLINFYKEKENGYFVDIGAHDGIYLSNSYLLEKRYNWRGICAEAQPLVYENLLKNRGNMICHMDAVYHTSDLWIEFAIADNDVLSGISDYLDKHKDEVLTNNKIISCKTISLLDLLDLYNAPRFIEYLSIDTEGSEYEILKVFEFDKYTFGYIDIEHNYEIIKREKIKELLENNNYIYVGENQFDDTYIHSSIYMTE